MRVGYRLYEGVVLVYIPYLVVRRYMMNQWRRKANENPYLEPLTNFDIRVQWFRWLEWVPKDGKELMEFRGQFPIEDRYKIE